MINADKRDAVVLLTLHRPEKRNCLHPDMIQDLSTELEQAANDAAVRVLVITGAGASFCAGLDVTHVLSLDKKAKIHYLGTFFSLFRQIHALRQPVIASNQRSSDRRRV